MINRRQAILTGSAAMATLLTPGPALASHKTARIIVSLADNRNQGIVPVPTALGNGQNPRTNLYWGALYGVKSFFRRQENWNVDPAPTENNDILESLTLWHKDYSAKILCEAWNGAAQKRATETFMDALNITSDELTIFVGHNPLMDVNVPMPFIEGDRLAYNRARPKDFAVIACQSRRYFEDRIKAAGHRAYVLTEGNMAPEAYVIEGILRAWLDNKPAETARQYAAEAYAKYQKIPLRNANWLFGV